MSEPVEVVRELVILNTLGLHARPAAMLVEAVNNLDCEVLITKDDLTVDAKSLMGVLTLAAECGSTVRLWAKGNEALLAVDRIEKLIVNKFDEEG